MTSEDEMLVVYEMPDTKMLVIVYLTKLKNEIFKGRLNDQLSGIMYLGAY